MVRYLADQVESLGLIATKTIKECPRLFKEVLAVREDTIAIDAFNLMVEKNVQGIAICNEDGRLRGNLRSERATREAALRGATPLEGAALLHLLSDSCCCLSSCP